MPLEKSLSEVSERQGLIEFISHAFEGVSLGDGIGLYQAQAIDDYKSKDEELLVRGTDEKLNWKSISSVSLNKCNSSLSFFDAEGMRFHLPAFLISDLKGEYGFGVEFCLTHLSEYSKAQFSLLSQVQREAVRMLLNFYITTPDCEFYTIDMANAFLGFWAEENDRS